MAQGDAIGPEATQLEIRTPGFAEGEVVVVTGGGSGIGRATALAAARSGLLVAVWDMDGDSAVETACAACEAGGQALAIKVDVRDACAVAQAWGATMRLGDCRYLVNNAGPPSSQSSPFGESLLDALGSVESVTMQWLEHCGEEARSMVNLASIAGNFQGGGQTIAPFYAAAKTGMVGYTRWLATRFGGRPRANAVAPGITLTPRTEPMLNSPHHSETLRRIPQGRLGQPGEVANAILFLLSPAASYINGVVLPVDGGMTIA